MLGPGGENNYMRTPTNGLLPYQAGNAGAGHSYIGTSSWYFAYAYIDNIYGSCFYGTANHATSATYLKPSGLTADGCKIVPYVAQNPKSCSVTVSADTTITTPFTCFNWYSNGSCPIINCCGYNISVNRTSKGKSNITINNTSTKDLHVSVTGTTGCTSFTVGAVCYIPVGTSYCIGWICAISCLTTTIQGCVGLNAYLLVGAPVYLGIVPPDAH